LRALPFRRPGAIGVVVGAAVAVVADTGGEPGTV
jgi:hypothetical protein